MLIDTSQDEFWLPLRAPYEGYAVSTKGRIKSLGRWVTRAAYVTTGGQQRSATTHWRRGVILQPHTMPCGHLQTCLGRGNNVLVHRMVLRGFVGPCPEGMETLHRNGTPDDNRPENLRYGTRGENTRDDHAHGKMRGNWRLTKAQAREIWLRFRRGHTGSAIAKDYGVSMPTVYGIKYGYNHKDVRY